MIYHDRSPENQHVFLHCYSLTYHWNLSGPLYDNAFRFEAPNVQQLGKYGMAMSINGWQVGGFKHVFFNNIWDNPSHWLIFFRGEGIPPTRWLSIVRLRDFRGLYVPKWSNCSERVPKGWKETPKLDGHGRAWAQNFEATTVLWFQIQKNLEFRSPCRLCHCKGSLGPWSRLRGGFPERLLLGLSPPHLLEEWLVGLGWNPDRAALYRCFGRENDGGEPQVSGVWNHVGLALYGNDLHQPWKKGSSTAERRWGWIGSQTQVNGPSQILDTRVKLRPRQVGQVGNKMFPPFSLQPIITYHNYNRLPQ